MRDDERIVDGPQLLKILGLARRAGRLAVGFDAVAQLVERGRRPLVVVAADVGPSQKKKIMRLKPVRGFWADRVGRDELAAALGSKELAVVALDDPDFLRGLGWGRGHDGPGRRRPER